MNNEQFDDLKQFIDGRIAQSETYLESKLGGRIDALEQKVDDGFAAIGDALDDMNERLDVFEAQTNRRLNRLEKHAA